ncbi:MAG TPA: hypothetical protein ENJ52_08590 [Aliiroseovarius sp.]|nr:hypothetical protein [Aliiroseovarius sp.]
MRPALRLFVIALPFAALGAGFLAYAISNRPAPARIDVAERAVPVRVVETALAHLPTRVTGNGLVRPARVFEAVAQVGGAAEWVDPGLHTGAVLRANRVFLRLSKADFALAEAQALANIRATEAKLAELELSEKNQQAALDLERRLLSIRTADRDRIAQLVEREAASASALDTARAAWLAQRQKVLGLENALSLVPTQRQVLLEQIAVYQATLETARLNLERTEFTLPFTGRVAQAAVETGQFVRQGEVVAVFDGVETAEVEVHVSFSDMAALTGSAADGGYLLDPAGLGERLRAMAIGAEVWLALGDRMVSWPARIDRLSDAVDQRTGTLGVILRVDDAYSSATPGVRPPLTKGMFVEAVLTGPGRAGIIVPRSAVRGGKVMIAGDDDRLRLVTVTVLRVQEDVALIGEGLSPGVRLVVSDPSPPVPGQLLEPVRDQMLEDRLAARAAGTAPEAAQ